MDRDHLTFLTCETGLILRKPLVRKPLVVRVILGRRFAVYIPLSGRGELRS